MGHSTVPWRWERDSLKPDNRNLLGSDGSAVVRPDQDGFGVEVGDGDAALIAAAPRMLALLRRMQGRVDPGWNCDIDPLLEELKKAGV